MRTLSEIETLLSSRRLDEAEAALAVLLAKSPADAEARMLLGICGQMKGDTDRFCRIYGELAPSLGARAEAGEESPVIARWRHYLRVATYLVALGVITLTGSGYAETQPAVSEVAVTENQRPPVTEGVRFDRLLAAANDPSVAQMDEEDTYGCRIFIGEGGSMMIISTGVDDFDAENGIIESREEAIRIAKSNLFKFLKENFSTEEQAESTVKKAKPIHTDGDSKVASVSRETLRSTVKISSHKVRIARTCSHSIILKGEEIPSFRNGGRYRVIIGVAIGSNGVLNIMRPLADNKPSPKQPPEVMSRYNMGGGHRNFF